ncbi:MAG: CinA family nicotinamide mononucleotide deamidase-related protein [Pirellulales bacterium]|nr:CinA family nicotinamide mononucleotide deamidase-related protein [Pirellulales bacterium]
MLAEVISIGDELTSGQRLDTNSQWLSQRLGELGFRVVWHTTVADDLDANIAVFRTAVERADVVVASGGLGPTADDLTRDAVAAMLGVDLVLDEAVLERIRAMFAFFKRDMPEKNRVQAMFPAGTHVIPNPHGTAPGIAATIERADRAPSRLYCLPGVPAEMFEMFAASVAPELVPTDGSRRLLRHRVIKCFGVGESHLEQMLPDLIRRGREPSVGITVSQATISLRITASGASEEACLTQIAPTEETIRQCLGDIVFGESEDELEHAVARLLAAEQKSLATAELGTGGLVAERLREAPEAAPWFRGGYVAADAAMLSRMIPVEEELARLPAGEEDSSQARFVRAAALACRAETETDLALVVGELPRFDAANPEANRVWFAVATADGVTVKSAPTAGHPAILISRTAKQGLNMVRLLLLRGADPSANLSR